MTPYVMFGHNRLVGDLADIVHANGGVLTTVVQNMEEERVAGRISLAERLEIIAGLQDGQRPQVVPLEAFRPAPGERYLVGFTGYRMQPLLEWIAERFGLAFAPLVHPSAQVSPSVHLPAGCIVNARAVLASNARPGEHVFINRSATIGHDTRLDDFCIVQPGANLAGHIHVGEGAVIGIGATVIEDLEVGHHAVVAAGAVVTRDVEPGMLVAGVPAVAKKRVYPPAG